MVMIIKILINTRTLKAIEKLHIENVMKLKVNNRVSDGLNQREDLGRDVTSRLHFSRSLYLTNWKRCVII